jgi:hypothetical protein
MAPLLLRELRSYFIEAMFHNSFNYIPTQIFISAAGQLVAYLAIFFVSAGHTSIRADSTS